MSVERLTPDLAAAQTRLLRYMGFPSSLVAASLNISVSNSTPYWRPKSIIIDVATSSSRPGSSMASAEPLKAAPSRGRLVDAEATKEAGPSESESISSLDNAASL